MIISTSTAAMMCLALNIYWEDKLNGYDAMALTAITVWNRAEQDESKVCQEVFRPAQFSWANPITYAKTPEARRKAAVKFVPPQNQYWRAAKIVAQQTLDGTLDSEIVATMGNAKHYYNPSLVEPYWASTMVEVAMVGEHRVMIDPRHLN